LKFLFLLLIKLLFCFPVDFRCLGGIFLKMALRSFFALDLLLFPDVG